MGAAPSGSSFDLPSRHPEPQFERIVRLARHLLGTQAAAIAFVEEGRVWIKAGPGAGEPDSPRETSLLGQLARHRRAVGIEDASADPALAGTPEVLERGVRAVAAAPVEGPSGELVGLLAVLDEAPRPFDLEALDLLTDLAALVAGALGRSALERWRRAASRRSAARQSASEAPEWLFQHSLDLMVIADIDGYFTHVSPSWTSTLGWSEAELLSRPYIDFVHPEDVRQTSLEHERSSSGSDILVFQNRYRCRDGSYRWLHWKAHTSLERKAIYAVARDITEAKQVEEDLRRAKEAAEAASRAKSSFLASMSHELRTPLNAILGFTKLLLRPELRTLGEVQRDYLRRVHASGLHLLGLVNRILDMNCVEEGRLAIAPGSVDLGRLVTALVVQLEGLAHEKGLELAVVVPEQLAPLSTDASHLQQILINLVGNAIKFTSRGSVRVHVEAEAGTHRPLRVHVIDTGIGIPPDQTLRIFEPFVQLDSGTARSHGGTGMGLAIVRALSEALGFEVSVRSEPGIGSTFTLELEPTAPRPDHQLQRGERTLET